MDEPTKKPEASKPEPKVAKVKTWHTKSGMDEHIPGLGFVVNDKMLQRPHVIKAIENFENRTGKRVMGTVLVLR